jgi:pilus assembly protein Flp/PilA
MLYLPEEKGQGLAEYGLILILIAIVIFVILTLLGTQVSTMFSRVDSALPNPG